MAPFGEREGKKGDFTRLALLSQRCIRPSGRHSQFEGILEGTFLLKDCHPRGKCGPDGALFSEAPNRMRGRACDTSPPMRGEGGVKSGRLDQSGAAEV